MITISDIKNTFDRDFVFSENLPDVRDNDILRAIDECYAVLNTGLYPDQDTQDRAAKYLTAHFLTINIDTSDSGGQTRFLQNSRSADGVSESVQIPDWIKGEFEIYASSSYGLKFLLLSKPYLDGAVLTVAGGTQY